MTTQPDPYFKAITDLDKGLVQILSFKGSHELTAGMSGRHLRVDPEGSSITLNLEDSFELGSSLTIEQNGLGDITITTSTGSIINFEDQFMVAGENATVGLLLVQKAPNAWVLTGQTK